MISFRTVPAAYRWRFGPCSVYGFLVVKSPVLCADNPIPASHIDITHADTGVMVMSRKYICRNCTCFDHRSDGRIAEEKIDKPI